MTILIGETPPPTSLPPNPDTFSLTVEKLNNPTT